MTAPFLASLIVLVMGLVTALAWGWQQRRALHSAQSRVEQGNADGERRFADLRDAHAALQVEHQRLRVQTSETQRELASLSYSISHDLRAPLRSVDGFSQALAEDYGHCLNATAHDYLRRVRANAQHMSDLIDELLALSRITRAVCRPERVDLSALAKEVAAELGAADPARRVEWDIQPGVSAQGDRVLLASAMRHLLGNAWKFTARLPVAHIAFTTHASASAPGGGIVYQVRDDGVGFDMQYAGKLFGAFQRMHPPEEFAGHGIGLATVQRVVRQHGGNVWADATPEQGAVFSFTLDATPVRPLDDEPSRLLPTMEPADAEPSAPRAKTTAV